MNILNIPEHVRAYIYRVLTYVSPIVVFYGLATIQEAGLWLTLAGAILGLSNGLAAMNTSTAKSVELPAAVEETPAPRPRRELRPVQRPKKF